MGKMIDLTASDGHKLSAYRAERQQAALERMLEEIRAAYEVRVEAKDARDA